MTTRTASTSTWLGRKTRLYVRTSRWATSLMNCASCAPASVRRQGHRRRPAEDLRPEHAGEAEDRAMGALPPARWWHRRRNREARTWISPNSSSTARFSRRSCRSSFSSRPDLNAVAAHQRIPGRGAAYGRRQGDLSRRQSQSHRETVSAPLEEQINGAEDMMYMKSVAGSDGTLQMTITFRPGTDPSKAQVDVQTVFPRPCRACLRSGQPRRDDPQAESGFSRAG